MRFALALALTGVLTLVGCYQDSGMDEEVLDRLLSQQAQTQKALDTAVKVLVSAAKDGGGAVHVEKVPVDGGTVIFALWPNGEHEIWGVADDGRTVSLAYDRAGSYKRFGDEGVSWIRR